MLIISPLEQFNVLSLYDASPFGGFEISYAAGLLTAWSLFYLYPVTLFESFLNNDFFVVFGSSAIDGGSLMIGPLMRGLELVLFFITKLGSNWLQATYSWAGNAWTFYHSGLTSVWADLLTISNSVLEGNAALESSLTSSSIASDTATALSAASLICDVNGRLVTVHLIFSEVIWYALSLVYTLIVEKLYTALGMTDLSYLIFSLNLSSVWQIFGVASAVAIFLATTWNGALTLVAKNRWQTLLEIFYQVILNVVNENAGPKGRKFFPLIFTTFAIILTCNVLGMIPYSFTVTSHLIVTFCTALAIFTGMNILGILKHRKHFLSLFFPPGAPLGLAPLLVLIEFISYVFRILSLSIRLFANLMSGHTLLKILATFSWGVVSLWGLFLLPVAIILIVTGLEMAIAFLQAYIFSVLLCIYLNDAFNLH